MNRTIGMGYLVGVLHEFFGGSRPAAAQLFERAHALIVEVSLDTAELLERVVDLAEGADLLDHDAITRQTALLGLELCARDRHYHAALDQIAAETERLARERPEKRAPIRIPERARALLQRLTPASCVATLSTGCGGQTDDNDDAAGASGTQAGGTSGGAGLPSGGNPPYYAGGFAGSGGYGVGGDCAPGGANYGGSFGGMLTDPAGGQPFGGVTFTFGGTTGGQSGQSGAAGAGGRTAGGMNGDGGGPPSGGSQSGGLGQGGTGAYAGISGGMVVDGGMGGFVGDCGAPITGTGNALLEQSRDSGSGFYGAQTTAAGTLALCEMPSAAARSGTVAGVPSQAPNASAASSCDAGTTVVDPPPASLGAGIENRQSPARRGTGALVEHWRDTRPQHIVRSRDLPLYDPPQVLLRAEPRKAGFAVSLSSSDPNASLRWQSQGQCLAEGNGVLWTPSSPDDQLAVTVRGHGGVSVAALRAVDLERRLPR